jgi:protein-disulfide isomerase
MNFVGYAFTLAGLGAALAAAWFTTSKLSDAHSAATVAPRGDQRAMEKVVHNYLLEHPEILPEAFARLQQKEVSGLLSNVREELETPFHGAIGGNPKGNVTLVVFFDFRCPYCYQAKLKVDGLIKADANLRVVYRDYPILDSPGSQPMSRMAASLALAAARQNKYVAFYDALFAGVGPMNQERLVRAARKAGLDERSAAASAAAKDVASSINRNIELGRLLGLSGTPAYVIGNNILMGGDKVVKLPEIISRLRG